MTESHRPPSSGSSTSSPSQPSALFFVSAVAAALVSVLIVDPFQWSPIAGTEWSPKVIPLPPLASSALSSDPSNRLAKGRALWKGQINGPESIVFDKHGRGPYASIGDGRIVRWDVNVLSDDAEEMEDKFRNGQSETFAYCMPGRNASTTCDRSSPNPAAEPICGRPMGIRFLKTAGMAAAAAAAEEEDPEKETEEEEPQLLVSDAYFGLNVVDGARGGEARPMALDGDGRRVHFCNDAQMDEEGGAIYFTQTSQKWRLNQFLMAILEGGDSGRLLKYDTKTLGTTTLVDGLRFANGVAFSKDSSFLVFCETTMMRCHRYWLKGPKSRTAEVFVNLPGFPDNVKLNPRGRFWIAIAAKRNWFVDWLFSRPWARTLLFRVVPHELAVFLLVMRPPHGMIVEVDENGKFTDVLEDAWGKVVMTPSEVTEVNGTLWIGSLIAPHIAMVPYNML